MCLEGYLRTPGRYLEKYLQRACWLQTWPERAQPFPCRLNCLHPPAWAGVGWAGPAELAGNSPLTSPPENSQLEPGTLWLP